MSMLKDGRCVALVTGASAGTGMELVGALGAAGYDVALLAARRVGALERLAGDLEAMGRRSLVLQCDLADEAALNSSLDRLLAWSHDRIDAVVNAAGIPGSFNVPIEDVPIESFDRCHAVNLRAPFLIMRRLLPVMYRGGGGRIVNIGGNHAMRGRAARAPYTASKWGLRGLTKTVALEAGPKGVNVNFIAPGPIAVERMRHNWRARADRDGVDEQTAVAEYMHEMGAATRRPSEARDIVAMVMFLLGEGGRNVTGQDFVIDGGIVV